MGECIEMLYLESKSCFFFIKNDFTFIKLLLQKDNEIIFSFNTKNVYQSSVAEWLRWWTILGVNTTTE